MSKNPKTTGGPPLLDFDASRGGRGKHVPATRAPRTEFASALFEAEGKVCCSVEWPGGEPLFAIDAHDITAVVEALQSARADLILRAERGAIKQGDDGFWVTVPQEEKQEGDET